jgi:hypothetical protein
VPDDVMASQVEAMNTSKAMAQCCEPRTVQLKKRARTCGCPRQPPLSLGTTRERQEPARERVVAH